MDVSAGKDSGCYTGKNYLDFWACVPTNRQKWKLPIDLKIRKLYDVDVPFAMTGAKQTVALSNKPMAAVWRQS